MKLFTGLGHVALLFILLSLSLLAISSCNKDGSRPRVNEFTGEFTGEFPTEFPIAIDLTKTKFALGEVISFTVTITNDSGRDVNIMTNGGQPWVYIRRYDDSSIYAETIPAVPGILKAGDKLTKTCEYTPEITGLYIVHASYSMTVFDEYNASWATDLPLGWLNTARTDFKGYLDDIIIEVR